MYFFIVNPQSGCGGGEKVWKKLKELLAKYSVQYESFLTERPGDARRFAAQLTEGCHEPKVIVVVGGDGTFNEVLDGLAFNSMITLGYVPAGSGNDLARSLRIPRDPARCLKRILSPKGHLLLDYGVLTFGKEAEHRRFAVSAGLGMDSAVCRNLLEVPVRERLSRFHLEKLGYVIVGLQLIFQMKPLKGYLILDRVKKIEFNHIYFMSAHIHPFEGGGFRFAPAADAADGRLSVCVISHENRRKLISALVTALIGRGRQNRGIRTYDCREVFFHVEQPQPVHVDGENCGNWSDLQAECIEKKIRMIR